MQNNDNNNASFISRNVRRVKSLDNEALLLEYATMHHNK